MINIRKWHSYHISTLQAAIEIPYCFAQAVIYGGIVYSMIGYEWTTTKYLWFMYFMFFTLIYFVYYGMMAVAMTPNHHIANIVSYSFYGFWNLFSGFIVPRPVSHDSSLCFYEKIDCKRPNRICCYTADDASLVEVVSLGEPRGLDPVRFNFISVWRHER